MPAQSCGATMCVRTHPIWLRKERCPITPGIQGFAHVDAYVALDLSPALVPASNRRFLGAAGVQYGRYVEKVLHASSLPRRPGTALTLTRVAMRAWDAAPAGAPRQDDGRPATLSTSRCVMALYQRGKQIWSQAASALVRSPGPLPPRKS